MPTCPTPLNSLLLHVSDLTPYCLFAACHPNGLDLLSPREDGRKQGSTPPRWLSEPQPTYAEEDVGPAQFQQAVTSAVQGALPAIVAQVSSLMSGAGAHSAPSLLAGVSGHTDRSPCTAPSFLAGVRGHTEGLGDQCTAPQRWYTITPPGSHANPREEEEEEPDSCFLPGKMEETESSEEEDETFSYYLTKGEVEKIWGQQYGTLGPYTGVI